MYIDNITKECMGECNTGTKGIVQTTSEGKGSKSINWYSNENDK